MGSDLAIIMSVILFAIVVIVMRLFGAWMFRINEVIKQQKLMLDEIKKLNKILNKQL